MLPEIVRFVVADGIPVEIPPPPLTLELLETIELITLKFVPESAIIPPPNPVVALEVGAVLFVIVLLETVNVPDRK